MIFRINSASGHSLYLQLMEQVRHAVETGVLQDGDLMPSIRNLAEELVISHNTVAKAYMELQHEGWSFVTAPVPISPRRAVQRRVPPSSSRHKPASARS